MKKLYHMLCFSGLLISGVVLILLLCTVRYFEIVKQIDVRMFLLFCVFALIPSIYIAMCNAIRRQNGEALEDVMLLSFLKTDEYLSNTNRERYLNPPVDKALLYRVPVGFCFGTWHGYYVCRAENTEGAILISGGSGTGKSSALIINYILLCKRGDWDHA